MIRQRFKEAKIQALTMIKNMVRPQVAHTSAVSLNGITLDDFVPSKDDPTLIGSGKTTEIAEWKYTWIEGANDAPRRTWTFVVDSDNPLPESSQEPHVGWTVSAEAGTQPAVANVFGHVWLDHVPVMRLPAD